ncbi:hypothetical protein HYV83_05360 [Candidatus Woesearchaeota archaeon]|nr:hypothetical protein [Candidatus Woesearchaeota archaeon]
MNLPKALSLILAAVVIANFLGLVFRIIKPAAFWVVTIIAAITAYKIIPKLAKKK